MLQPYARGSRDPWAMFKAAHAPAYHIVGFNKTRALHVYPVPRHPPPPWLHVVFRSFKNFQFILNGLLHSLLAS